MRTKVPAAFVLRCDSVDGPYELIFRPTNEWDGIIEVSIGGQSMRWDVVNADIEAGVLSLGGMTTGTETLWNDEFWFELLPNNEPPTIRYWGDKVIWREDYAEPT